MILFTVSIQLVLREKFHLPVAVACISICFDPLAICPRLVSLFPSHQRSLLCSCWGAPLARECCQRYGLPIVKGLYMNGQTAFQPCSKGIESASRPDSMLKCSRSLNERKYFVPGKHNR